MALPYVRPTTKKNPYRSKKGCLTCKKRNKKCDETQPQCRRCIDGGFDCLGYSYPSTSAGSIVTEESTSLGTLDVAALFGHPGRPDPVSSLGLWMGNASSWIERVGSGAGQLNSAQIQRRSRPSVPQGIRFDPFEIDNMISFVVLQVSQLPSRASFRPFPFSIEHAIARHLKSSPYTRWSMYIGARIGLAMSEGTSWCPYIGWIDDFRARILNLSIDSNTESTELDTRLGSIQGLTSWSFAALGSLAGYVLHKRNLPLFLQLATRLPEMWMNSYEISISRVFYDPDQSISQFIFTDTVTALAFGLPPLIRYDTTVGPEDWLPPPRWSALDRVTGWPVAILILFAKINSLGVARQSDQPPLSEREREDIKQGLRDWKPVIDHDVNSSICITQLVIQECWRHALLIYMYMAACGLNSADPRVEYLVQQMFLLAGAIEGDHMSEEHLFIPCLIAGVAARKEKHRRLFHRRMPTCRRLSHFLLQGLDFIPVLDHLWRGAAAGGRAVTWGDYVNSRSSVIPINV